MNIDKENIINEINEKILNSIDDIFLLLEEEKPIPIFESLPDHYKDDEEIMLGIIKDRANDIGSLLFYCSDRLKSDADFVYEILEINEYNFSQASFDLQNDKEFVLKCIELSRFLIEDAPEHFLDDKDCAIAAIKRKGHHALQVISDRLKDDKDVAIAAINHQPDCYKFISERLQYDQDIVLLALQDDGLMQFIPKIYRDNKKIMFDFFNTWHINPQSVQNLQYVSENLKNDSEIVMSAIQRDGANLQFAAKKFKQDKSLATLAIENFGSLEFLSSKLRNDREIVLLALKNSGSELKFASNRLKNDKDIVAIACKSNVQNIQYASLEIREEIGNNNPVKFIESQKFYEKLQEKIRNKNIVPKANIKI